MKARGVICFVFFLGLSIPKQDAHRYIGARLKGQLKNPDMSYIYERKGLRAERIVNVPENFNEEIVDGAGQF